MTAITTTPTVRANAAALVTILARTDDIGLPMPFSAAATNYGVELQFKLPALTEWSLWLGLPLRSNTDPGGEHHTISTDIDGFRLSLGCYVPRVTA